jgi:hypothetical protein
MKYKMEKKDFINSLKIGMIKFTFEHVDSV